MIVITTPAGQIGRQVLSSLLRSGERLRVIARDRSQLPAEVREDLDIVEGSHGDAAVADKAFAGADAVLWVTPVDLRAPSVDAAYAGPAHRGPCAVRARRRVPGMTREAAPSAGAGTADGPRKLGRWRPPWWFRGLGWPGAPAQTARRYRTAVQVRVVAVGWRARWP